MNSKWLQRLLLLLNAHLVLVQFCFWVFHMCFFLSVSVRPIQAESKLNERPYVWKNNKIKVIQIYKVNFKTTLFSSSGNCHCTSLEVKRRPASLDKVAQGKEDRRGVEQGKERSMHVKKAEQNRAWESIWLLPGDVWDDKETWGRKVI